MTTTDAAVAPAQVSRRRRWAGRAAVALWTVAFAAFCVTRGVPFDRAYQTLWILAGLAAFGVGRPWRRMSRVLLDWVPFIALLYLYDYSRGAADLLGSTVQVAGPVQWEKALFLGNVPTTWLQERLYDPSTIHWWETVCSVVYVSHFVLVWAIAAVLYLRNRDEWFRWARAVVVLSFAALATFAVMPSAPPWYASGMGLIDPVHRIATRGLEPIGLHGAQQLIDQGRAVTNDVAAIPSLHTGFAVLVCIWFWPQVTGRARYWLRPLLVAYPVVMLFTLVYSGEHYVIDGLVGAVYVVGVLAGLRLWDHRRAAANAARAARSDPDPVVEELEPVS